MSKPIVHPCKQLQRIYIDEQVKRPATIFHLHPPTHLIVSQHHDKPTTSVNQVLLIGQGQASQPTREAGSGNYPPSSRRTNSPFFFPISFLSRRARGPRTSQNGKRRHKVQGGQPTDDDPNDAAFVLTRLICSVSSRSRYLSKIGLGLAWPCPLWTLLALADFPFPLSRTIERESSFPSQVFPGP
jgi:hypothetical protein